MYHNHSYSAAVRPAGAGHCVRIIDRYWPGGPDKPEYSKVIDLEPWEARALAESLAMAAQEADVKTRQAKLAKEIKANTAAIAQTAKEAAFL